MSHDSPNIYSGELSDTRKKLWQLARQHRDRAPLYRLRATSGQFVWGHPVWKIYGLAGITMALVVVALVLSGGRFDASYWPLWLAAGVSALILLAGFLFVERFTLDTLTRRWSYRRGWRWDIKEENGGFDELAGFKLFSHQRSVLQPELLYGATLEFADGYRFFHAVLANLSLAAARSEVQELARACGLPLTEALSS
jgi:hypothetical protein